MSIGATFDAAAREYDRARRALVPGFDGFYEAVFDLVPHGRDEGLRVLDLGAGTGLLSAMVAGRFPRSEITLVDLSAEMLGVARRRFVSEPGRFRYLVTDYATGPLPGEYEVVVSALSIHHLTDRDKKGLFRKVYGSLVAGGVFVNADQALGETPEVEEEYRSWWLRSVRRAGVGERDLTAALNRMKEDRNATLKAQLGWLRETGFEAIRCSYEDRRFAVYGGRKAGRDVRNGKEFADG